MTAHLDTFAHDNLPPRAQWPDFLFDLPELKYPERMNRIANVLTHRLGVAPGHRVLLRGPNNPMMVAAYLGVVKAGGVVVATMPLLRAKELATMIAKAKISLALCDA